MFLVVLETYLHETMANGSTRVQRIGRQSLPCINPIDGEKLVSMLRKTSTSNVERRAELCCRVHIPGHGTINIPVNDLSLAVDELESAISAVRKAMDEITKAA